MKIAIIDPVGIKAGMNCYDLGLLNELSALSYQTFLFSNFSDSNYPRVHQYDLFLKTKQNTFSNIYNFVASHVKALITCRKQKVSWVILHIFSTTPKDYFSVWIIKKFGFKVVSIIHDIDSLSGEDNKKLKDKIYDLSDAIVVHNTSSKTSIEPELSTSAKNKLHVIPHGNYVDFISGIQPPSEVDGKKIFEPGYRYILFFGQIKKVKGLDILLRAVPMLPPEVKVIIAGRPHRDDFVYYQDIIDELGIENRIIKIIRFITDEERHFFFGKADALVLPYRKIFQSGVLLLSMSYGLPVIASDLPANKEIITDGINGILFKDGDCVDLAEKIKMLLSDTDGQIGKAALQTVIANFSWGAIAKRYTDIFKL